MSSESEQEVDLELQTEQETEKQTKELILKPQEPLTPEQSEASIALITRLVKRSTQVHDRAVEEYERETGHILNRLAGQIHYNQNRRARQITLELWKHPRETQIHLLRTIGYLDESRTVVGLGDTKHHIKHGRSSC